MSDRKHFTPFSGGTRKHLPELNPPLGLVVSQIVWPQLSFMSEERMATAAADFGEKASFFPLRTAGRETRWELTHENVSEMQGGVIYSFLDSNKLWNLTLTSRSITLSTSAYSNFQEFETTLEGSARILLDALGVTLFDRVGYRYINWISGKEIREIRKLFHPSITGLATYDTISLKPTFSANYAQYSCGSDIQLTTRSGLLPIGQSPDASVAAFQHPTWVWDIEAYKTFKSEPMTLQELMNAIRQTADADYDYFQTVITDSFIEKYRSDNEKERNND